MHGGDVYHNRIKYDFSVNINPMGVAPEVRGAIIDATEMVDKYPEYNADSLREAIAAKYKINDKQLIVGNGASELITAICQLLNPGVAVISGPAFTGYERALEAVGTEICFSDTGGDDEFVAGESLIEDIRTFEPDIVFIANPSNPAGRILTADYLRRLADVCFGVSAYLVVDECFIELTGMEKDNSLLYSDYLPKNVIVLRAFTKTFAIPGIRLGYAVCGHEDVADRINARLPEWNISVFAMEAGKAALELDDYIEESVKLINQEREFVKRGLRWLGFKIINSEANYVLFLIKNEKRSGQLGKFLIERGILIRDCSDYVGLGPGYYRVAVKNHADNVILIRGLRDYRESRHE